MSNAEQEFAMRGVVSEWGVAGPQNFSLTGVVTLCSDRKS
jgi:hypothetical protein